MLRAERAAEAPARKRQKANAEPCHAWRGSPSRPAGQAPAAALLPLRSCQGVAVGVAPDLTPMSCETKGKAKIQEAAPGNDLSEVAVVVGLELSLKPAWVEKHCKEDTRNLSIPPACRRPMQQQRCSDGAKGGHRRRRKCQAEEGAEGGPWPGTKTRRGGPGGRAA